jgi:DNA ligase (NAD+)
MTDNKKIEKIKELMREKIEILDRANRAYYAEGTEIMSNFEYDRIYDDLVALEEETGIILSGSPTQKVGHEVVSELPKERHASKMLSLSKTKSRTDLLSWLGDREGILSWKLDGITIVLTYENGTLLKAVTRGNGEIGEVVTPNARNFLNLPRRIKDKGRLVLRGEAVIRYDDFQEINENLPEDEVHYKNPRNLCAGSVRQLDSRVTKARRVRFYAFTLVQSDADFEGRRLNTLSWLRDQGFDVVPHVVVNKNNLLETVQTFEDGISQNPLPSDGLVLAFDDMAYSKSLGETSKFPRDAIAFKWQDETAETVLREIEWSASRTGLINPIAIFDPVELEGTTVSRASVHNISLAESLKLGIGDRIKVYKANMIIPQIAENLTKSDRLGIPDECPVCGTGTNLYDVGGVKTLHCPNKNCPAKLIKSFNLFTSRDAMDIGGLSEATIRKFIDIGILKEQADFFHLGEYEKEITSMEGFGKKSFENLKKAVEAARETEPAALLYALGIPGIGTANAKLIAKACRNDFSRMRNLSEEELISIDGIGEVMARNYRSYFDDPVKSRMLDNILREVHLNEVFDEGEAFLSGKTFVITGNLEMYKNRRELTDLIEEAGGKTAGSVSGNTSYLINNDTESSSAKNKKAKEIGIPIIDEKTINKWLTDKEIKE